MIAAGIRDYTARPFFGAKRCNLVVCPTQLEGADGLKILRLEIQSAAIVLERQQGCTDDDSVQPGARFVDVGKGDDGCASKWQWGTRAPRESMESQTSAWDGSNFQYHWHDQRPLLGLLGNISLQIGTNFFLDDAIVSSLFVARLCQCLDNNS